MVLTQKIQTSVLLRYRWFFAVFGVLTVLFFFTAGLVFKLYTMPDETLGDVLVEMARQKRVAPTVLAWIDSVKEINPKNKLIIKWIYQTFLEEWDRVPPEKQHRLKAYVGLAFKKMVRHPGAYREDPPDELFQAIVILTEAQAPLLAAPPAKSENPP
jgi:hypothetical protein